jgi:hypothetical protein
VQQFTHVKKGISDNQNVRIWGQKEQSGHQKSLEFPNAFPPRPQSFYCNFPPGQIVSVAAHGFVW